MADPASKFTDEELKKVEKQLKSVYSQAYLDILQKQNEFNRKYEEKSKKYLEKVAKGEMTQAQYSDWLKGQVFQGDQWQAKKEQMIDVIYNSNKTATDILNGKTKSVFAFNASYANYDLERNAGVNFGFGIYDTNTVINLVKNDPKLLPEWKIDQAKDYRWSQKKLNKQVSLGIIEGESLDKIATRLCSNLCTTNFNKMRTFARTSMTGAQNEGRLFSYENAKELDIKVKKQWMCTLDDHTRITHQQLDGQIQETDKPFEVNGLKIMYPGDPNAEPALVFNCRCTMVAEIDNYPSDYERYDNIEGKPIDNMTYEEWEDRNIKLAMAAEDSIWMLDESEASNLIDLFSDKKMSRLYNEMRELDTKTATAFYNELKSMGKPSEVWQQYLNGTLPSNIDTSKLNGILQSYAEKKGLVTPNVTEIRDQLKGIDLGAIQKKLDYNEYSQLYGMLKSMSENGEFAPAVWDKYLAGKLSPKDAADIEKFLRKYSDKLGINIITPPTPITPNVSSIREIFADKKMSNVFNEIKSVDKTIANKFYKELGSMGKPSEVWQQYLSGKLNPDQQKVIEGILSKYADKAGIQIKPAANIFNPKEVFADKKMSKVFNELKEINSKDANKFYNELKKFGKPSEAWERYLNGTLKSDKLDELLRQHFGKDVAGSILPPVIKKPDRNWVESMIDKNKFNRSAANAESARRKTIDTIMQAPENYRKCFIDTLSKVTFSDDNGKAYYFGANKEISINFEKILRRDKSLGTLFHENGHAIDHAYALLKNPNKKSWNIEKTDYPSMSPKFLSAIEKDLKNISKNIDSMGYHRDMWDNSSKGVQDFFSALRPLNDQGPRKGTIPDNLLKLRYNWCHSYDYYTRYDDPMIDAASELFANISGGRGDMDQMMYIKKYFPNSVKAFDGIMDEMAAMIKL